MSDVSAPQLQQSAPTPQLQPASQAPAPAAPAVSSPPEPTIGGNRSDPAPAAPVDGQSQPVEPAPKPEPAPVDDWRAKRAGDDPKKLELLARYQSEDDWANSWFEQKAALSKRAEPVKLADNATPEQIAEYRKGLGVPEVKADAEPAKFMEAYKIKAPEGYEMSDFEKGMVGDFAKQAYAKGWSPAEVKGATDFFFQQQTAAQQARNVVAADKQKEWTAALKQEWGRDFDAQVSAAESWLKQQFGDDQDGYVALTRAELPNGGLLGDNPWFIKTIAKLAAGDGFTDQIEANAYESTGKSLEQQQREIEGLFTTDRARYDEPKTQAMLDKIISLRLSRGEIDESGNPVRKRRSA